MTFKIYLLAVISVALFLTSCKKETGCTNPTATNYNPEASEDDGSCIYLGNSINYNVPSTYEFTRDGENTVNFEGQAQRLEMLGEMSVYIQSANTPGTAIENATLLAMYGNEGYIWTDTPELGLIGSTKQLEDKTAASSGDADEAIINLFKEYMNEVAALSAITITGETNGMAGQGGVVLSTTNPDKQYLQNEEGKELHQYIEKGLMGAVFYNQIQRVYLGPDKLEVDNTTAVEPADGKYYTLMEHHWDEAYGYFTTAVDFPIAGIDRFWGKYADARESVLNSSSKISEAFRKGRAAISNNDLITRDAQIAIIRAELELVAAGTAIHYLNGAIADFGDDALRNHQLSEAHAFASAIPYGHEPAITISELTPILDEIGNDYYAVSIADLVAARDLIASATGLSDLAAEL